jgi:hypothetical protein
VLKLLLLEIVVEKKKGRGEEGGKGRKERKGGRGKKKGCSRGVFLIFLFAKYHFFPPLFLNFLTCKKLQTSAQQKMK